MKSSRNKYANTPAGKYNKEMSLYSFIFQMISEGISKIIKSVTISTAIPIIMTEKSGKIKA